MAGLWLAALWVPGVQFAPSFETWRTVLNLLLVAFLLALANSIIRPIIRFLAFPLYIITLGLFVLITNGLIFLLVAWLSSHMQLPLEVYGFGAAVLGGTLTAIIAAIVAGLLGLFLPKKNQLQAQ